MDTAVQWTMGDPFSSMPVYYAVTILIIGLLECFVGYKIFKIQVGIVSFIGGFSFGYMLLGPNVHYILGIAAGILIGALLAALSVKIYKAGVFLFVGFLTGLLVMSITGLWWAGLITGIILGALGAALVKPGIIISSSLAGGSMIASGALGLIRFDSNMVYWIASIVLAIVGAVAQFNANKDVPMAGEQ